VFILFFRPGFGEDRDLMETANNVFTGF